MATRFYFPADTATPVTPAIHANWTYTSEYLRRRLAHKKGTSTVATGTNIGAWTSTYKALDRQYVSDEMAAGIEFSTSVTVKGQLRVAEYATSDNVNVIWLGVAIYSSDGGTLRRQLLAPAAFVSVLEFSDDGVAWTNRRIADGDALAPASSYTTVDGDRLVIEIGYTNTVSGTTPNASAKWGESEVDLGENTTDTTGSGWIEFSNNILMLGEILPFLKTQDPGPVLVPGEIVSY